MFQPVDKNFRSLNSYDEIWFIGDHSSSFSSRAGSIANRLENFKGVVVTGLSSQKRNRIAAQLKNDTFYEFLHFDEFIKRKKNLLLVDFNDSAAGVQFRKFVSSIGIDTVDYLRCMNDLSLTHTYLPVDEERREIIERVDSYLALIADLPDLLSKETILSRLKVFLTLDRIHFHKTSQPFGLFSKNLNSNSALYINDQEHYIDVGAAHGDTVAEFFNSANGNYQSIHAFEPDRANYYSLKNLCSVLKNTHCYWAGLSNKVDQIDFYETPENRFGSRFDYHTVHLSKNITPCKVDVLKMDDVVDFATVIKIDVEGYELNVIEGAESIISKQRPAMNMAGYHFPKDIVEIITLVKRIYPYKSIAVRHFGNTIYDTNILFSDRQQFI